MNPLTLEWIKKAEGDYSTAVREYKARKNKNYDAVCFHAQQCIEKYMKAILQEQNHKFDKTHNLIYLLEKILDVNSSYEEYRKKLQVLNNYSVKFSYPGEESSKEEAKQVLIICSDIRIDFRNKLEIKL